MPAYKISSSKKITYTKGELFDISKSPLSQQIPKCFQSNLLNDIPLRRSKNGSNYNYKATFASRKNIDDSVGKKDFSDNFADHFNQDTYEKGQKFAKNSFNHNKPFRYEHDNLYQNKPQKSYCKPTPFLRDYEKRRFEPNLYGNSKGYKPSEPEWFSEGPFSHLDKMELKGFEDGQNSPENDSHEFEKNLFRQNLTNENDVKSQKDEAATKNILIESSSLLKSLPEEVIDQIQLENNGFEKQSSLIERKESRFHALFENKVQSTSSSNISDAFKSLCGTTSLPTVTETETVPMTPFEKLVLAVKKQEANPKALNFASQPDDAITEEDILREIQTSTQCNTNSYGLFTSNFTTNHHPNSFNEFNKVYPEASGKEPINEATFNMLSMIASSANTPWAGNLGKFYEPIDATKNVVNHFYSNIHQYPKTAYQDVGDFVGGGNKGQNDFYPTPSNFSNIMLPPVAPGSGPWYDYNQNSQHYHRLKMLAIAAAAATINNQQPPVNPIGLFLNAPIPCQPTAVSSSGSYAYHNNQQPNVPKPYSGELNKMNSHVQDERCQSLNLMEKATSLTPTAVFRQLVSSTLLPTKADENLKFKNYSKSQANPILENVGHPTFGNNPEVIPSSYKSIPKSDIMNLDNDIQQRQHMLMSLLKNNNVPNLLNYRLPNFGLQPNMSSQNLLMLQHQYTMLLNLLNSSNNLAPNQKIILQNYFYQLNSAIMAAGLQHYFMANPCLIPTLSTNYFQNIMNPPHLQPYVPATSTQNPQSQNRVDEE